ncbi:hypothetical protein DHEL01_v210294 [Diaporthe helianthi]|uniref:Yeast cell wall synthesis Kre9/Knh1-like N-terminal domain-containing protein n=1 Tax=Diaporthe helianthi TaxID=158607 RepID=A0A2P5HM17_DIAHE|nr:hypothetical protein DHEL01_v210294 [Diaporthe helianthi]
MLASFNTAVTARLTLFSQDKLARSTLLRRHQHDERLASTSTEPQQGAKLDFSGSNTISWTLVDTDPVTFEIILVSPSNSTITQSVITESVNTTKNKYSFSNFVTSVGDN